MDTVLRQKKSFISLICDQKTDLHSCADGVRLLTCNLQGT